MLKLQKSQYLNSIFKLNYTKYEKRYDTKYKNLQVWTVTFIYKMYIFLFNLKKYD